LGEQESHEMAGPTLVDPVRDHLCVPLDDLAGDRIYIAS
jgi:hypothetical protein